MYKDKMTDLRKAAEMALEALEQTPTANKLFDESSYEAQKEAIQALRKALAEGVVQEIKLYEDGIKPKREWAGLTDKDRSELLTKHHGWNEFGKAIEAKLKEKNHG